MARAKQRVASLQTLGVEGAYIYGDRTVGGTGGIDGNNSFFILTEAPEVYNLPAQPELPQKYIGAAFLTTLGMALGFGAAVAGVLWGRD